MPRVNMSITLHFHDVDEAYKIASANSDRSRMALRSIEEKHLLYKDSSRGVNILTPIGRK